MQHIRSLYLACALCASACTFEPSHLAGGPQLPPSGAPDAATPVPDAAVALDAPFTTAPDAGEADAAPVDAEPPAAAFCNPGDPALVGCFAFENDTADASSAGLVVTAVGVSFDQGMRGLALVTTDQSSVSIAETPDLDVSAVTVEMWVRPGQIPASGRVGIFDNDGQYGMFVEPGGTVRCSDGSRAVTVSGAVAVDVWAHVACTHDGQTITVYIDGQSRAVGSGNPLSTGGGNGCRIASNSPSGDPFTGRIDELRIWSRVRTPGEICAAAGCTTQ